MFEHSSRNPAGYISITEPGKRTIEQDTKQCVHCGGHFQVVPGSGIKRGYCRNCMGVTCGKPECNTCLPFQKWMDLIEANDRRQRNPLGIEVR